MVYQRIFEVLLFISEGLVFYYYAHSLFSTKKKDFFSILGVIVAYLLCFLVYLYGNGIVNTLGVLIINILLFFFLFKCNIKNAIFHSTVLVFLMLTTELLSVALTTQLFNVDFSVYATDTTLYILNIVISKMLYYIFCFALSRLFNRSKGKFGSDSRFWVLMIVPLVSLLILTVLFNTAIKIQIPEQFKLAFSISSFLLMISNIIVFFVYERSIKDAAELIELKTADKKNETDKLYYSILEHQNQSLKVYAHDTKKHLTAIRNLTENEEIINYLEQMSDELNKYNNVVSSGNHNLDVILNKYITECEIKEIDFKYDVRLSNLKTVEVYDLVTILGNALDNALESAVNTKEKRIELQTDYKNNFDVIVIKNSCDKKPFEEDNMLKTTKQNKSMHGLGLKSMKNALNKYNGDFSWEYIEKEKMFILIVMVMRK